MYTIIVETRFQAAHQLDLAGGETEPEHKHDWSVTAEISSDELSDCGMVADFHKIKAKLDKVTDALNGTSLNSLDYFRKLNPAAETVARYIFERLEPELPLEVTLQSITVGEQIGCWGKFSK